MLRLCCHPLTLCGRKYVILVRQISTLREMYVFFYCTSQLSQISPILRTWANCKMKLDHEDALVPLERLIDFKVASSRDEKEINENLASVYSAIGMQHLKKKVLLRGRSL